MDGQQLNTTQLFVVRGNSAAGKTTLAAALQKALGPGTANVGQDHFRRVVLREHEVPDGDNIGLIAHTVRYCLDRGYHVILEGMLRASRYGNMIGGLVAEHPGPTHTIYLDVPLEETLRRHKRAPWQPTCHRSVCASGTWNLTSSIFRTNLCSTARRR